MDQQQAIDTVTSALKEKPAIRALFLSGSHGTGFADRFSDVDLVLIAPEGATDEIVALWREAVEQTGEIVLWWDHNVRPLLVNAITADWLRIDLVILKPDQMGGQRQDGLKVLFDHDGLYPTLPEVTPRPVPDPKHMRYQIEEFIRILGLLPLAVGRQEYLNGVLGVFHLRNKLVDLMIAETGIRHRGGLLHLNRLITEEQKQALAALPAPEATQDRMVAAHLAYAAAYLPRARRLARIWGVDWPERFEEVTWARLADTLKIDRPYGGPNDTD